MLAVPHPGRAHRSQAKIPCPPTDDCRHRLPLTGLGYPADRAPRCPQLDRQTDILPTQFSRLLALQVVPRRLTLLYSRGRRADQPAQAQAVAAAWRAGLDPCRSVYRTPGNLRRYETARAG